MEQQLLQEQKKPNALAFQVAISFAIYILILTVVMRILKIDPQGVNVPVYQTILSVLLAWGTFIFAIYYAQNKHKQELGGFITYGRAFSTGFKVAAYAGLFIGILMFIYYQFVDPGAMTQIMDNAIAKADGDENKIKGIEMMSKYMIIFTVFGAAIMYAVVGLIISLITAAIIKKDRPAHFDDAQ
jgi:hypothetical protein